MAQSESSSTGNSTGRVLLYWLIVGLPLTWGVAQSVNAALPLFGGKSVYIPWVIGAPPAKTTPAPAAGPAAAAKPAASAAPTVDPSPAPTAMPMPEASPFSTAQPSATVAPIDTPAVPKT